MPSAKPSAPAAPAAPADKYAPPTGSLLIALSHTCQSDLFLGWLVNNHSPGSVVSRFIYCQMSFLQCFDAFISSLH